MSPRSRISDEIEDLPRPSRKGMKMIIGGVIIAGIAAVISGGLLEDVQEGYIAVRQIPLTGQIDVKSTPGPMLQLWGPVSMYKKAGTYDFSKTHTDDTLSSPAINVQFNDGATAAYSGKARFRLPTSEAAVLKIHEDFNRGRGTVSYAHLADSLIRDHIDECLRMTAALMSSQEAYQSRKSEFSEMALDQLRNGIYLTQAIEVDSDIASESDDAEDRKRIIVRKRLDDAGLPMRKESPLNQYDIEIISFTLGKEPVFDTKTMDQIETARSIFLRRLEARAQAETAQQEKITAKASGEAAVETTKYQMLVEKERALIEAEQKAEVAVIEAQKKVDVAEKEKLEEQMRKEKAEIEAAKFLEVRKIEAEATLRVAELDRQAAEEEKQAAIARGEGEAEARRLVLEADNALKLRLETEISIQEAWAEAFANYRNAIVPGVVFQGGGEKGETPNGLEMLMKLMAVREARVMGNNVDWNNRNTGSSDIRR